MSLTVTVNEQLAVLPDVSVAVQVTVVVPFGKLEPDPGVQAVVAPGQLSLVVGFKRPDEPGNLHSGSSRHIIGQQNKVVRLTSGYVRHCTPAIIAYDNSPAEFLKDLAEQSCGNWRINDQH